MRFRSIAVVTLLSFGATGTARAQTPVDPQCTSAGNAQDVCQQAVDLLSYMVPQLGISITGGNPTLGQGGTLGGLPHFTVGLRANVLAGAVPQVQTPTVGAATRRNPYATSNTFLGLPAVDASVGLFKGLPLGVTNVGGIDLLLSASYVPKINKDDGSSSVKVAPNSAMQLGYGVRIGLLQESLLVPGVSFSYLKRDLPATTITGTFKTATSNDSLVLNNLALKTNAWRLTASKSLILFTIAAGVGQDTYDVKSGIHAGLHHTLPLVVNSTTDVNLARKMTRTNYFADVAMNLLIVKLVGEIGMVSGGEMPTYNTFSTAANASRTYGSVGLRVGF